MSKRTWYIVGAAAAVLLLVVVLNVPGKKAKPETQLIDFLTSKNADLTAQNKVLSQATALLSQDRDKALHEGDSLKVVSDSATKVIRRNRTTIPSLLPPSVVDTTARRMYAFAVAQLDSSLMELMRKDRIISDDSLGIAKMFQIEVKDELRITNLEEQVRNTEVIANQWHKQYDDLNSERHPLCGRKCGVVLGILGTVAAALAVHQVQEVTK